MSDAPDELELATRFHDTYERLAPSFGYETRKDTRSFDPTTPNGKLMIAVCAEVLSHVRAIERERDGQLDKVIEAKLKVADLRASNARLRGALTGLVSAAVETGWDEMPELKAARAALAPTEDV